MFTIVGLCMLIAGALIWLVWRSNLFIKLDTMFLGYFDAVNILYLNEIKVSWGELPAVSAATKAPARRIADGVDGSN